MLLTHTSQFGLIVALKWALIELSRNPDIQNALRNELQEHIPSLEGLTYDKLMNGLPYLDALVCETLRLHVSVDLKRQVCLSNLIYAFVVNMGFSQ